MKCTSLFLLAASLFASAAFSQSATYEFLRTDVGARAAALSGSFVSMTDDPTSLFYNPAATTTITRPRASVGYFQHLAQTSAGHLAYTQQWRSVYLSAGAIFVDYGTMKRTDISSNILGEFGARELALAGGMSVIVDDGLSVGGAVKFVTSTLAEYHSSAIALDAGILYDLPAQRITLGASIQNLGTQVNSYAGIDEALPIDVRIGVTTRPEHLPVQLNFNIHKLNESADNFLARFSSFSFGAEFAMSGSVRLRVGYNNEQRRELKLGTSAGLLGFSFGLGILVRDYQIDYAFNSLGKIGGFHRFGLGIGF
jgi:long-subunit fatty acid transport protein